MKYWLCRWYGLAAGPWVNDIIGRVAGSNSRRNVRLVKGSHIIVPKFWEGRHAYLVQNHDKRVIFINPYEGDLALIGGGKLDVDPVTAGVEAFLAARDAGDAASVVLQGHFVVAAEGSHDAPGYGRSGAQGWSSASIFAAQMKSFAERPPMAWVV